MNVLAHASAKLLAGLFLMLTVSFADATAIPVNFEMYNSSGAIISNATDGEARGILGDGSNKWLNNPELVNSQHLTPYLVRFWIAPGSYDPPPVWSFSWELGNGMSIAAQRDGEVNLASVTTSLAIGTGKASYRKISSQIDGGSDSLLTRVEDQELVAGETYVFADANTDTQTGNTTYMGSATEMWVYVSGRASYSGSSNIIYSTSSYANVYAVVSQLADDGVEIPEPHGLLLFVGSLMATRLRGRKSALSVAA